jgi:hypothetical protein
MAVMMALVHANEAAGPPAASHIAAVPCSPLPLVPAPAAPPPAAELASGWPGGRGPP